MTCIVDSIFWNLIALSGGTRFPEGGRRPRRRGADSQGSYVSKISHVDTEASELLEERRVTWVVLHLIGYPVHVEHSIWQPVNLNWIWKTSIVRMQSAICG